MKKFFTILGVVAAATVMNAQIVISEVYGGGGNSGATLTNDFVELVNKGTSAVTLNGAYLQYASATGSFSATNILALPSITLQPGQYYLIQLAKGAGGTTALPTPDFAPSGTAAPDAPLALSGTNGKIALTSDNTLVSASNATNVIDFVGWGTANMSETSAAPATTNTTSINRTNGIDTNNNSADFTTSTPTPQNSSNFLSAVEVNGKKLTFIKNTVVNDAILFGAKADVKIYDMNGRMVKAASVNDGTQLNVSALAKGIYIVAGEVEGQKVTQKIIKK